MKTTTLQDRIKLALEHSGLSKTDLWKGCGVSSSTVTTWFNGRNKNITGTNLISASKLLGVNPNWLASGVGEMLSKDSSPKSITLPIINHSSVTGVLTSLSSIEINSRWLKNKFSDISDENFRLFIVPDSAMSPNFEIGDLLLLDASKTSFEQDGIYVIREHGKIFIRRIQVQINGKILVRSDNPTYENQLIDISKLKTRILGKALWAWTQKNI